MVRLVAVLTAGVALAALAGCSGGNGAQEAPTLPVGTVTDTTVAAAGTSDVPSVPPVETTTTAPPLFPAGYPKVVTVASLPFQVRNWYQQQGDMQAVAVAPGVWAPLPAGATTEDAATAGVLDGFCASVKAYERQYLNGQQEGGACW